MMSEYTRAESFMIMCLTRERDCTPEKCKKCGWISNEDKAYLQEHGDEYSGEEE